MGLYAWILICVRKFSQLLLIFMEQKPLLTIAIPTYNRINDLKVSLGTILSQAAKLKNSSKELELIISDNASVDGTCEYIKSINTDSKIIYHRNDTNLGADGNISLCYKYASGKFLWIFSDDDFLVDGSLEKVMTLLKKHHNIGNCYISSVWDYKPESYVGRVDSELSYSLCTPKSQLEKVNYWVTFISANIVNKELLGDKVLDALPVGTSLIQLGWIIPAIFSSNENIYIDDKLICCRIREDRGYNIIQIFCTNLMKILKDFENKKPGLNLVKAVSPVLIRRFLFDGSSHLI
jgi:abequosyltransferase